MTCHCSYSNLEVLSAHVCVGVRMCARVRACVCVGGEAASNNDASFTPVLHLQPTQNEDDSDRGGDGLGSGFGLPAKLHRD